jgi:hypothetical protein
VKERLRRAGFPDPCPRAIPRAPGHAPASRRSLSCIDHQATSIKRPGPRRPPCARSPPASVLGCSPQPRELCRQKSRFATKVGRQKSRDISAASATPDAPPRCAPRTPQEGELCRQKCTFATKVRRQNLLARFGRCVLREEAQDTKYGQLVHLALLALLALFALLANLPILETPIAGRAKSRGRQTFYLAELADSRLIVTPTRGAHLPRRRSRSSDDHLR